MNKEVLKKSAEHSRTESDRALATPEEVNMTLVKKAVTKTVEVILFDVIVPCCCIAVKGRQGLREVISRRKEEERRQKEAASENKEEKK